MVLIAEGERDGSTACHYCPTYIHSLESREDVLKDSSSGKYIQMIMVECLGQGSLILEYCLDANPAKYFKGLYPALEKTL